ncbi:hypothetical protein SteCoe_16689 [Stentor coeruleus]|uniref:Uncharacterized protein n=1 Tax=Stentor coeruleus TaxID=5963 RepID=A0A1R2C0S8_9CILI|nr:hypothetical protein SteCoe_16689 [Stentor coeruleus]
MEVDPKDLNHSFSPSLDFSVCSEKTQDFISPWAQRHLFLGILSIIVTIFLMDNYSSIDYTNIINPGLYLLTGAIGVLYPLTLSAMPFIIFVITLFFKNIANIGLYLGYISTGYSQNDEEFIIFCAMLIGNLLLAVFNFLAYKDSKKACDKIFS